jgi:hypothetical protein
VSRNCNLLQHDDEPLDGYLFALCCPQLLIKCYGFYPKTKKKEKSWSIQKTSRMCQCTRKTIGKTKKKSSILGIFNILQYYFQCPQLSWCCVWCLQSLLNTHFVQAIFIKIHTCLTLTIVSWLILKVCMCISSFFCFE